MVTIWPMPTRFPSLWAEIGQTSYQILSVYPEFIGALQCNAMPLRGIGFESGLCDSELSPSRFFFKKTLDSSRFSQLTDEANRIRVITENSLKITDLI